MSLSKKIIIALALGISIGIFFGEEVAFLGFIGEIFIRLLQMSVLPYITVALTHSIGSLSFRAAGLLLKTAGVFILLLWGITIFIVLLMPLSFPSWESASFFSTTLLENQADINILDQYFPSNPFYSLAFSVIPAVVLFSVAVGIALIKIEGKERFLNNLAIAEKALGSITRFIIHQAPYGVFAISAAAAGTMDVTDIAKMNVYTLAYISMTLLTALWVLPALVAAITPLSYKDLMGPTRDALITAFAIGNVFAVLPVLLAQTKVALEKLGEQKYDASNEIDVIIPTSYNFPKAGNIMALSFVLFAGWYTGFDVSYSAYPYFALSGIISFFGGNMAGTLYMLDMMQIPADTFELFLIFDNIFMLRFGSLASAVYMLVLTVLSFCAIQGLIIIKWTKLIRYLVITLVMLFFVIGGIRFFFENVIGSDYQKGQQYLEMEPIFNTVPTVMHNEIPAILQTYPDRSRMEEIRERGFLRVGYTGGALPFAFINASQNLVGLDTEMAHQLASELDVEIQFVELNRQSMTDDLNRGIVDIIMSGIAITTDRASEVLFSQSTINPTIALVVRDHRRDDFKDRESIQSLKNLRLGSFNIPYYDNKIRNYLPDAEFTYLDSPQAFFEQEHDLDGLILTAETGSAWSLIYPQYTVVVPEPDRLQVPMAYAVAQGEREFAAYVNTWLLLKDKDKTLKKLYDYWILGDNAEMKPPRWSVIRDVLHWID